jgi:hypothetical protein
MTPPFLLHYVGGSSLFVLADSTAIGKTTGNILTALV